MDAISAICELSAPPSLKASIDGRAGGTGEGIHTWANEVFHCIAIAAAHISPPTANTKRRDLQV